MVRNKTDVDITANDRIITGIEYTDPRGFTDPQTALGIDGHIPDIFIAQSTDGITDDSRRGVEGEHR